MESLGLAGSKARTPAEKLGARGVKKKRLEG